MTTTTQTPAITPASPPPDVDPAREERAARLLRAWAIAVLVPVALVGAVLSFDGLHSRARVVFSDPLAYGFPLLVDALILGCTLAYLAGAKVGRPRGGWRLAAHAGIAGTIALNAAAARTWAEVPWHITAPIVWSVLVELTGKELLGEWTAAHQAARATIPARLWVTAPVESLRTWLRIARRLDGEQTAARLDVGVHAAAAHALALAVPGRRNRKVRRILRRQLRAGSLSPLAVLGPLGWTDDTTAALAHVDGPAVLRAALRDAIRAAAGPTAPPAADTFPTTTAPTPHPVPTEAATSVHTDAGPTPPSASTTSLGVPEPGRETTTEWSASVAASVQASAEGWPGWLLDADDAVGRADIIDVRVSDEAADDVRDEEDGPEDDGPGPSGGGAPARRGEGTSGQSGTGDLLADAVRLVQADPQLTGAQMSARMATLGHAGREGRPVSDRTGRRWIADAVASIEAGRRDRLQVVGGRQ